LFVKFESEGGNIVVEFDDGEFEKWERQVNEQLAGLTVEETGSEDDAVADVKRQIEERGMSIDDADALRIVREARNQTN
jgi:hypothetical protein